MDYRGFKIEPHGGGVGYIVTSSDGYIVSSQPSEEAARKWVDEFAAQQTSAPPPRGQPGLKWVDEPQEQQQTAAPPPRGRPGP